jgi:predicted oxidoreductase
MPNGFDTADAIVVGAGLAGLVAAAELADAGRRVIVVDQEARGVAGRAGVLVPGRADARRQPGAAPPGHPRLARAGVAGLARDRGLRPSRGEWPRRWAEAYVDFCTGEKRAWLAAQGVRFTPNVAWAERGGYLATGHGNSVPRFHITWGTGADVLEPFIRACARRRRAERSSCASATRSMR